MALCSPPARQALLVLATCAPATPTRVWPRLAIGTSTACWYVAEAADLPPRLIDALTTAGVKTFSDKECQGAAAGIRTPHLSHLREGAKDPR